MINRRVPASLVQILALKLHSVWLGLAEIFLVAATPLAARPFPVEDFGALADESATNTAAIQRAINAAAADWTMHDVVVATPTAGNVAVRHSANIQLPHVLRVKARSAPLPNATKDNPLMRGLRESSGDAAQAVSRNTNAIKPDAAKHRIPKLFLIGDSTVQNGWARAPADRSSRTILPEGLWDQVLASVRPGDFVMLQFGHNDGGPVDEGRARASIKGVSPESQVVTPSINDEPGEAATESRPANSAAENTMLRRATI